MGIIEDLLRRLTHRENGGTWLERLKACLHPYSAIRRGMFQLAVTRDLRVEVRPGASDGAVMEIALPTFVFHIRRSTDPSIQEIYNALDEDDAKVGITFRTIDRARMEAHMKIWEHTPSWTEDGSVLLFFLEDGAHEFVYSTQRGYWEESLIRPENMGDHCVPGNKTQVILPRDIR